MCGRHIVILNIRRVTYSSHGQIFERKPTKTGKPIVSNLNRTLHLITIFQSVLRLISRLAIMCVLLWEMNHVI